MPEYGLFNDEGLVEDGFYTLEDAEKALKDYDTDDDLRVFEVCPEHEEEPKLFCEKCNPEEGE